jgi:hypothetical protein
VPAGGFRRGRRDNGLSAAEYAAVGDVDPRVGEHLLDVLAGEGIAAYLLPATDLHPVTRTTTLPARPTDRLYADREHLGTAKEYLSRLRADEVGEAGEPASGGPGTTGGPGAAGPGTPGGPGTAGGPVAADPTRGDPTRADPTRGDPAWSDPTRADPDDFDVEAAWASIVAGYDEEIETAPWPATENVPERAQDDTDPDLGRRLDFDISTVDDISDKIAPVADLPARPAPDEPTLLDALDTFGAGLPDAEDAEDTEDEGYTPPPPPPVPRPPVPVVLAFLGIAAGLVLFFRPGLLPIDNDLALLLGFCALLAGVITLIWRLRPGDEEDDDSGDDGAVV